MSWEAWGTPPEPEPAPAPEMPELAPAIGPRQQWCCANGCGPCTVKTIDFAWRTITNIRTGHVQRDTYQMDVSECCSADLMLWDEAKQDFVDWQPVQSKEPANV